MSSTVGFWLAMIVVLLLILRFVRKYLGRILLILLFLFVLFFVFKWINPRGANAISDRVKDLSVAITAPSNTLQGDNANSSEKSTTLEEADQPLEKDSSREETLSRFARLFGKKKKSESSMQEIQGSGQNPSLTGTSSVELKNLENSNQQPSVLTGMFDFGTGEISSGADTESLDEETEESEEIIYIKSNPKPASTKTSTFVVENSKKTPPSTAGSSRGLSAEDLKEAHEIFGN